MKATLKSIDKALSYIDGINNGTSNTPFMDMARVVALLENKSIEDVLAELPTMAEVLTIYSTDVDLLLEWLKPTNNYITSFEIDGVTYDVCPAELLTPNRVDLVIQIEAEMANNKGNVASFQFIADGMASYCYSADEINVQLETPKLDDELHVKNTKEQFMMQYKNRCKLFYEKIDLATAAGVRNFFFQITKS